MNPITEELPILIEDNIRQYTRGHFLYPKPIRASSDAKFAPIDCCQSRLPLRINPNKDTLPKIQCICLYAKKLHEGCMHLDNCLKMWPLQQMERTRLNKK